jgi:hypothetical protein
MCWQLVLCTQNRISSMSTIYALGLGELGECEEGTSTHVG